MSRMRDAAQNWEAEHAEMLTDAGLRQGECKARVFYHEQRGGRIVVHGDDFTVPGASKSLDWLKGVTQSRMEVKFKRRLRI
jgi:hypothetical protein